MNAPTIIKPDIDTTESEGESFRSLPFVDPESSDGRCWSPAPSRGFTEDCLVGHAYALAYLSHVTTFPEFAGDYLGSIVLDMIKRGATQGHIRGFFYVIEEACASGAKTALPELHKQLTETMCSLLREQRDDTKGYEPDGYGEAL